MNRKVCIKERSWHISRNWFRICQVVENVVTPAVQLINYQEIPRVSNWRERSPMTNACKSQLDPHIPLPEDPSIILPSTPGSPIWSLSGFPTKILYTILPSPIRATCPAHFILLDFITRTILGEYRLSSSLCSFLHSPVTLSLLGPNILNIQFSNTLSLRLLPQC